MFGFGAFQPFGVFALFVFDCADFASARGRYFCGHRRFFAAFGRGVSDNGSRRRRQCGAGLCKRFALFRFARSARLRFLSFRFGLLRKAGFPSRRRSGRAGALAFAGFGTSAGGFAPSGVLSAGFRRAAEVRMPWRRGRRSGEDWGSCNKQEEPREKNCETTLSTPVDPAQFALPVRLESPRRLWLSPVTEAACRALEQIRIKKARPTDDLLATSGLYFD